MIRRLFLVAVFVFIVILPVTVSFAESKTGFGFVRDGVWFSKDLFFAGDEVRIYSAVFNSGPYSFSGMVDFFVDGTKIGSAPISVGGGGRIKDVWSVWVATSGNHKFYAEISGAKIMREGGVNEAISLENYITGSLEIFVDSDTDKDGLGDLNDPDDDNDGINNENDLNPKINEQPSIATTITLTGESEKVSNGNSVIVNAISSVLPVTIPLNIESVLKKVERGVLSTRDSIDSFAQSSYLAVSKEQANSEEKIKEILANGSSSSYETPFEYLKLYTLSSLAFMFGNELVFYFIIAILAIFALKKIFQRRE